MLELAGKSKHPSRVSLSLLERRIEQKIALERSHNLARALPKISERQGVYYKLGDQRVVGFCSNDYLGLAETLRIPNPAECGSTASRLICGNLPAHRALEQRLAHLVGYPDAVLFPSGFQLNTSVPACVVGDGDRVFSDRLNHASIIDGLRLSRSEKTILPHRAAPPEPSASALSWWFSESAFSMDGDYAPAKKMYRHLNCGGLVYLDEAHSFGLHKNLTWSADHNLRPTLLVGTFGKALGCAGAFVASTNMICEWIRTHSRGIVFSTGTSPLLLAAIDQALSIVTSDEGDELRAHLANNLARLCEGLGLPPRSCPIVPLVVGNNRDALAISRELLERGFHVQAIRPPTVPRGASRLRLTVCATHKPDQIDALTSSLHEVFARRNLELRTTVPTDEPLLS